MEEGKWWLGNKEQPKKAAEVVGSNPILSTTFILVNYGIELTSF
jgi:hypothetical protein